MPLNISFEFFPPVNEAGLTRLWNSVERLAPLNPEFVSVTYGAGGTTRDRTRAVIAEIVERTGLAVAGHLTCVGATKDETMEVARGYLETGANRVVALRGDPPKGETTFTPHPEGFASAAELVSALAGLGLELSVAAYPEKHPEAESLQSDIENLKRKIDAGGGDAITQFFFDNDVFFRFRDACAKAGIDAPIVPGLLPVENFKKMTNFAKRCDASVPAWMHDAYEGVEGDAAYALSVELAAKQAEGLLAEGVDHLHFYTLNNPNLSFDICQAIGVKAE